MRAETHDNGLITHTSHRALEVGAFIKTVNVAKNLRSATRHAGGMDDSRSAHAGFAASDSWALVLRSWVIETSLPGGSSQYGANRIS